MAVAKATKKVTIKELMIPSKAHSEINRLVDQKRCAVCGVRLEFKLNFIKYRVSEGTLFFEELKRLKGLKGLRVERFKG